MTILHSLNRLRLRCGLFFWRNYAWIEGVADYTRYTISSYIHGDYCTATAKVPVTYAIHWIHAGAWNGITDAKTLATRREAIAHIRRCVRRGER